ncbi:hypothetical protein PHYSODRAFT_470299 [Phytophthora sojae]|uniref:Uncharacterized protein n=1 Tax=Phytophthora sojae (strain P6497) TaxID=1094619 RepID=G4YI93_PHYSP|nr:hypothetical protein PHYSODRAFT_470299 [Phytophthora sojae]EGZ27476.1 hypothetical protein PHYSODRAFT_470299 [Phytophthora sojae]|eukprot:XP_009514751.1 hypothetical protein PHYSODRAFT_470299 [Phytophthora sojae]
MSPYAVSANSLAFIGPAHAPTLTEFCYVRVLHVEGDSATVRVVGPDAGEDGHELQLPVAAIDLRVVDAAEAELWPGDYVGQPVAFVQPSGPSTGQWAYGVVIRYEMLAAGPSLSLLVQQNAVIMACRRRRGELPASVQSMLTAPFIPEEIVPLIRPHDLATVQVRRQHVLDCLMGQRKKNALAIYNDPQLPRTDRSGPGAAPQRPMSSHMPDDLLSITSKATDDDIQALRNQNRMLGKRSRAPERDGASAHDDRLDYGPSRGAFRPAATQQRVSRTILHCDFEVSRATTFSNVCSNESTPPFLAVPPVCRGLLDFGFGVHGLSLMYCHPADLMTRINAHGSTVSFTDFSKRNTLRPAQTSRSRTDVSRSLRSLRKFAEHFYTQTVVNLVDDAISFIDSYQGLFDSDSLMAFWITSKFSKFRSMIVSRDVDAARSIGK